MRRRLVRLLGVASLGCAAMLVAPSVVNASPTDGDLTRVSAPSAGISLPIPAGWHDISPPPGFATETASAMRAFFSQNEAEWSSLGVDLDKLSDTQLSAFVKESLKDIVLWSADTLGDGDNVDVKVQSGTPFRSLDEWRKYAVASAKSSKGTLVSTAKARIGSQQAYTSLERDPYPGGESVYYGYLEIARGKHSVVSISLTVDGESRALAEAMLGGVTASH